MWDVCVCDDFLKELFNMTPVNDMDFWLDSIRFPNKWMYRSSYGWNFDLDLSISV